MSWEVFTGGRRELAARKRFMRFILLWHDPDIGYLVPLLATKADTPTEGMRIR